MVIVIQHVTFWLPPITGLLSIGRHPVNCGLQHHRSDDKPQRNLAGSAHAAEQALPQLVPQTSLVPAICRNCTKARGINF
jgi:hypothetical protein